MTRQLPVGRDYLLLAALYFIGAKIGSLTVMPEGIAIIWPPNGVLLVFLIRFEGRGLCGVWRSLMPGC